MFLHHAQLCPSTPLTKKFYSYVGFYSSYWFSIFCIPTCRNWIQCRNSITVFFKLSVPNICPHLDPPASSCGAMHSALDDVGGSKCWGHSYWDNLHEKLLYYSYLEPYMSKNLKFTNTLAARGLEEPRNSQELLTESVDLTKFVGPLPFSV
jgi:hypothetical protein